MQKVGQRFLINNIRVGLLRDVREHRLVGIILRYVGTIYIRVVFPFTKNTKTKPTFSLLCSFFY